jgi:hypothetical protein
MKRYAVSDAIGRTIAIFDVANLADAVAVKHRLQREHNNRHAADEVFSVNEATKRNLDEMIDDIVDAVFDSAAQ